MKKYSIDFYEKVGCAGNKRQKALLRASGIEFSIHNILGTSWTKETLSPFFEGLEPKMCFNLSAPKVKQGRVDIETIDKEAMMAMMLKEPILIKRPLLKIDEHYFCGFEEACAFLNIKSDADISACQKDDGCTHV